MGTGEIGGVLDGCKSAEEYRAVFGAEGELPSVTAIGTLMEGGGRLRDVNSLGKVFGKKSLVRFGVFESDRLCFVSERELCEVIEGWEMADLAIF